MLRSHPCDLEGVRTDLRFFVKELQKKDRIDLQKTILFGRSLGSHMVSYLVSRFQFHSAIIFCGFYSVSRIVSSQTASFLGQMIQQQCNNYDYLKLSKTPVLILHGKEVGIYYPRTN